MSFMLKKAQNRLDSISAQGMDPCDPYNNNYLPGSDERYLTNIELKNRKLRDTSWK